jgi:hypothetical protein
VSVFEYIYRANVWNGVESRSGPGSGDAATRTMRRELLALIRELNPATIVDAACGDSYWMPDLEGYTGVDIVPAAIDRALALHPTRRYLVGDVREELPDAELVLFRDAMQHMPLADGVKALEVIRASWPRWLIASTYLDGENVDIENGGCYRPDLAVAPFDLGPPDRVILDGWSYEADQTVRDPQKVLGLWTL